MRTTGTYVTTTTLGDAALNSCVAVSAAGVAGSADLATDFCAAAAGSGTILVCLRNWMLCADALPMVTTQSSNAEAARTHPKPTRLT